MIVTPEGQQYADMQRVAERFDDTTAEVLWFLEGYVVTIHSGPMASITDLYAAYCQRFATEHPGDSPVPIDAFAAAIGSGFIALDPLDPQRN
jgi:hypothetical protein